MELYAVKVTIEKEPIEPYLMSVVKEIVFKGEFFKEQETIEEIRDYIYENIQEDRIEYFEVRTYVTEEQYSRNEEAEYLGE